MLDFKTLKGHHITVFNAQIRYDNRLIFKLEYDDDILYNSKSNCLREDGGSVFLFIAINGSPNLDRLQVFSITPSKATLVSDAILSPVKDYDGDGYLEFGGSDLTEYYKRDSMYYIPTAYYEIHKGKIIFDKALTKREDIKINGLYLPPNKQADKDGNCCIVVSTPLKMREKAPSPLPKHFISDGRPFMAYDTITVWTSTDILEYRKDINFVIHDTKGNWLFYSDKEAEKADKAMSKTSLGVVVKIDKSVLLLSNIQKGWFAERSAKTAPWGFNILTNLH